MDIQQLIIIFLTDFIKILGEMSPYLLLGFFFAGLLHAFVPQKKIEQYFSGKALKSSFLASIFGIPLPLCSCGVIPTGAAFYKNGASKGGTVSFLISTPQTGVDSILATFSLMGLPFAIIRPIAALVTGVTGGIITSNIVKNEAETRTFQAAETIPKTFQEKVVDTFKYGFIDFIQDISKWLVIGLVLAAVISALIPDEFFEVLNLPPIAQMFIILIISIPLYICATGSIPLAAILLMKGISPGAAFVLLMAGPATNMATITMIGKVLGKRSLFSYLSTIIIGAISFGILIDYALPSQWFTSIAHQHLNHNHGMEAMTWWQISSAITLALLIINGYVQKYYFSNQSSENLKSDITMATETIKVEGMSCNHCKMSVETNLEKLPFIESAKVSLNDKTVTIEGNELEVEKAKETINSLGFEVVS